MSTSHAGLPTLSITLRRHAWIIELEGYQRSVTFHPNDKDKTMKAIVETLKELGEDISGDTQQAKYYQRDLEQKLTDIYKDFARERERNVSEQEMLFLATRSILTETFRDQQDKFYGVLPKKGYPADEDAELARPFKDKEEMLSRLERFGNHRSTMDMDAGDFDLLMLENFYKVEKKVPSKEKRKLARDVLKAFTKIRRNLVYRIAYDNGRIYYDLHDEWGRAVEVSKDGWKVVKNPLLFKKAIDNPTRFGQVLPDRGYDRSRRYIKELSDKATIAFEHQKIIDEVWTVLLFVPHIPHPVIVPHGPKGSGKTTHQGIKKMLVDPDLSSRESPQLANLVAKLPKDPKDRRVDIYESYMLMYDNASWLQPDEMDDLSMWVTGQTQSVRVLHTTDEKRSYSGMRILGINGVNIPISQSDLLDRCFILELESLKGAGEAGDEPSARYVIRETVILRQVWKEMPQILGYVFDLLSRVLARYEREGEKIAPTDRLGDFTVWGELVARELGYREGEFLEAWRLNADTQSLTALRNNSLASLFIRYCFDMQPEREFTITPTVLFQDLQNFGRDIGIEWYKDPSLPKNEVHLSRKLNVIRPDLMVVGLHLSLDRTGAAREIRVTKDEKLYGDYQKKQEERAKANQAKLAANSQEDWAKKKQMVLNTFEKYLHDHDTTMVHVDTFKVYLGNFSIDAGLGMSLLDDLVKEGKIMKNDYGSLSRGIY